MNDLRSLPSVDQILGEEQVLEMISLYGRPVVLESIRQSLDEVRQNAATLSALPEKEELIKRADGLCRGWFSPAFKAVINASGVILHTNLGRAPLCPSALEAIRSVSEGYSSLELDLEDGTRGSRLAYVERLITKLSGAKAGLVVNNNAAALLLALSILPKRQGVIISRTQLVEIGGSFRIPDVMAQSGARLCEVGTTNKVHLLDYEEAIKSGAGAVLHAHHSNFRIVGFTSEPSLDELALLSKKYGILLVEDLGSGALLKTEKYGLEHEPTIQEAVASGADLVCFSGDKLLGGPQAGIVVGSAALINKLKKHPLARAMRADKLCLAALTATLQHYIRDEAESEIPVWRMISTPLDQIERRAHEWVQLLGTGKVLPGLSAIGGGSLPGETLPTRVVSVTVKHPNQFLKQLRHLPVPVIARIENDEVVFDPRTVLENQISTLLSQVKQLLSS
jgi:L-seryl-tRNA(Ser) seleniumtransferase